MLGVIVHQVPLHGTKDFVLPNNFRELLVEVASNMPGGEPEENQTLVNMFRERFNTHDALPETIQIEMTEDEKRIDAMVKHHVKSSATYQLYKGFLFGSKRTYVQPYAAFLRQMENADISQYFIKGGHDHGQIWGR